MRLGIIPNDPIETYIQQGLDWLKAYYNPLNYFDKVYIFSPLESKEWEYEGMVIRPIEGWPNIEDVLRNTVLVAIESPVDIVRAYNPGWACLVASVIQNILNVPAIASVHDIKGITRYITMPRHVLCVSKTVKNIVLEYGVSSDQVSILPNRVNLDIFFPRPVREIKEIEDKYLAKNRILSVGRLADQKNPYNVLLAAREVVDEEPDTVFLHIGNGPLRGRLEEMRDKLNLSNNYYFLGNIKNSELPVYYSWADCFLFPSLWEGFGIVIIEALACGTPVITSNRPPMTELVRDKENGLLVDPENYKNIAEKVLILLRDKELKQRLGKKARESVRPYEWKKVSKMEIEIYKRLLRNPKSVSKKERIEWFDKNENIFPEEIDHNDFRVKELLKTFGRVKGKKILDAGCGKGRFSKIFISLGAEVTGVDTSIKLLESAKRLNGEFKVGDITDLEFDDETFDYVFSVEVIEHVENVEQAIKEMTRVLKVGGKIAIIDKNKFCISKLHMLQPWERWFTIEEVKKILKKFCRVATGHYIDPENWFIIWKGLK